MRRAEMVAVTRPAWQYCGRWTDRRYMGLLQWLQRDFADFNVGAFALNSDEAG